MGHAVLTQVGVLGAGLGRGCPETSVFLIGIPPRTPCRRTIYFDRQAEPDVSDFDQVGITLRKQAGKYIVASIATKNGRPTVVGVEPGGTLVRIDGHETFGVTLGRIYRLLHRRPGETRLLVLKRATTQLNVRVSVTAF
ncbi:MAG TPA: hypothetical protein VGG73_17720 [Vicinamibacterales bacterium]